MNLDNLMSEVNNVDDNLEEILFGGLTGKRRTGIERGGPGAAIRQPRSHRRKRQARSPGMEELKDATPASGLPISADSNEASA